MRYGGRFYGHGVLGRGVSLVSMLGAEIRASQILRHTLGDGECNLLEEV